MESKEGSIHGSIVDFHPPALGLDDLFFGSDEVLVVRQLDAHVQRTKDHQRCLKYLYQDQGNLLSLCNAKRSYLKALLVTSFFSIGVINN